LNTKDETLKEILSNGKKYFVPRFQRDYSWGSEQLEDLWEDINNMKEDDYHYVGYLVLQEVGKQEFKIIDGQQRLTTFSLMVLAAIKKLKERGGFEDDARGEELYRSFIGGKDIQTLELKNKLKLNINNDFHYKEAVEGKELPRRRASNSVVLMGKTITFFYDKFKEQDSKKIAGLIDKASIDLFFTSIYVGDEINAYKVFETLNSRGVQLTSGDLLKNYLFSLIDSDHNITPEVLENIEDKWRRIGNNIGNKKYTDYILSHWNSSHKFVRKTDLFKNIRNNIKNKGQAENYLDEILKYSVVYAALQNDEDEFWRDFSNYKEIKRHLYLLRLFNIKQHISLLLIAYIKKEQDFSQILEWVSIFSLRYNIICNEHGGVQEKLYNDICLGITQGWGLKEVKEMLLSFYPSDDKFERNFIDKTFPTSQSNKRPRYILARLIEKEKKLNIGEADLTVEHILPAIPSDEWQDYFGENWKLFNQRLGNMTLVDNKENKLLDQKSFQEKKEILAQSQYQIFIDDYSEWFSENITSRQKKLATLAVRIWRID
jgi:uncharacterized protein with ParB-like and HNH nuclease domain